MPHKININHFIEKYRNTRLFQHLSDEEINASLKESIVATVQEGEYLVHEGDTPSHLFFVLDGTLITSRTNIDGDEISIRLLKEGDCCMDAVIFMGGNSPINVAAASRAEVLKMPTHVLKILVENNIHFSNNMIKVLAYFYKESMLQIDNLAIKDSKTRVGYYLLRSYLENENAETFQLSFKKNIIANYLGMTPETFSRVLKEMQVKDKILTIEGAKISLTDSQSLCHFCDATTRTACHKKDKEHCKH